VEVTFNPFIHSKCTVLQPRRHVASQAQYLVVQYKDGRKEHLRGPQELQEHPLEHEQVEVHEAIKLAANEALVVYRRHGGDGTPIGSDGSASSAPKLVAKLTAAPPPHRGPHAIVNGSEVAPSEAPSDASSIPLLIPETAGQEGTVHVERRLVHGPAVFSPDSSEWLHTFSWHGSVRDGKGSKTGYVGDTKVPHALNFQVLRCMPDQMYLTVRDVRTVDDANLTVHLMLFYELKSIEKMLDSTNDMIGDFVNSTSADVMTFASRLSYETLLSETAELSRVANFPILTSRMEQVGVELLKVVYRGYSANQMLQDMHDQAISRRTKLRLEADAAREEQEKRGMELRCRRDRSAQEQELEAQAARHKLSVVAMQREQERQLQDEEFKAEMANERARHEERMRREKEQMELEQSRLQAVRDDEHKKYEGLNGLGVDLTQYLVALAATRPDNHLKIDSNTPPSVHLELPSGKR